MTALSSLSLNCPISGLPMRETVILDPCGDWVSLAGAKGIYGELKLERHGPPREGRQMFQLGTEHLETLTVESNRVGL